MRHFQLVQDTRNFRTLKKTYSGGQLSETRHFYYNGGWQVLEERATTENPAPSPESLAPGCQYVWGVRYTDDLILRNRDADQEAGLEERLYVIQDANWNVVAVAEEDGDVVERYSYTAYGTPTVLTGSFGSRQSTSYAWDVLYTGRQYDTETGLYYYRNRYFGAEVGRFVARDPIGYKGGWNLYRYVGGAPSHAVDPSGLASDDPADDGPIKGEAPYDKCGCESADSDWIYVDVNFILTDDADDTIAGDMKYANNVLHQCCIQIRNVGTTKWSRELTAHYLGSNHILDSANPLLSDEEMKLVAPETKRSSKNNFVI